VFFASFAVTVDQSTSVTGLWPTQFRPEARRVSALSPRFGAPPGITTKRTKLTMVLMNGFR